MAQLLRRYLGFVVGLLGFLFLLSVHSPSNVQLLSYNQPAHETQQEKPATKNALMANQGWSQLSSAPSFSPTSSTQPSSFPSFSQTTSNQPSTSPAASPTDPRKKNKVAICVTGQLRTLTLEPSDPMHPAPGWGGMKKGQKPYPANSTAAHSITQNLYPKLNQPDVFVLVSTREEEHEPKANETSACEPLRPTDKDSHLYCEIRKETEPGYNASSPVWDNFWYIKVRLRTGFLHQIKDMHDCFQMVEAHSERTGVVYDWLIRLRPDTFFFNLPDLDTFNASDRTIWYWSKNNCCCGNEDQFGFGTMRDMKIYMERYEIAQKEEAWDWAYAVQPGKRWSAEMFVQRYLKIQGISLKEHPGIIGCTIKPLWREKASDP